MMNSINQSFLSLSDKQGGFYYGASYQANFILNYFLSNLLKFPKIFKFPLKFSISNQPGWQVKTSKATLATKASGWMVILVRRGFITVTESSPLYLSHCSFLVSLKQNKQCVISNFSCHLRIGDYISWRIKLLLLLIYESMIFSCKPRIEIDHPKIL